MFETTLTFIPKHSIFWNTKHGGRAVHAEVIIFYEMVLGIKMLDLQNF